MSSDKSKDQSKPKGESSDRQLQREILGGRQFSIAEAIAREGGSFLKGESPVPKLVQATREIDNFISQNINDSSGSLATVLQNWVKADGHRVSRHLNSPLDALAEILETLLESRELLYEFVREVDMHWGKTTGERPYFQKPGQTPHPDDEYTHESVRQSLDSLLAKLKA